MSHQRNEDFDSIYASIDDDDFDEMYVDVSLTPQTSSLQGPSPYVYPQAAQPPPSPSVRKLPPLPVKSTIAAASKPPWPRPAPQPPENQESIKINTGPVKSSDPNRNVPLPLPRTATIKKNDSNKPVPKYRQVQPQQQGASIISGYKPPPSVFPANRQATGQSGYPKRDGAAATKYQDVEIHPANNQANTKLIISPPQDSPLPPPNRVINRQDFAGEEDFPASGYTLNSSNVSEYESLRPARSRLRRGYGQQSQRSRRYSDDQIPLEDVASDVDVGERRRNRGRRKRKERKEGGEDDIQSKSDNSRIVCILLTIIVVALLISLMSLAMSLYTLTRFELFLRSNSTASECGTNATNCTMMA